MIRFKYQYANLVLSTYIFCILHFFDIAIQNCFTTNSTSVCLIADEQVEQVIYILSIVPAQKIASTSHNMAFHRPLQYVNIQIFNLQQIQALSASIRNSIISVNYHRVVESQDHKWYNQFAVS